MVILDGDIKWGKLAGAYKGDGSRHHFRVVPGQKVRGAKTEVVPFDPRMFMLATAMEKAPIDQCGAWLWP